jgi:hypothetical protein
MKLSLKEYGAILAVSFITTTLIQALWPSPSVWWVVAHFAINTVGTFIGYAMGERSHD